MNAFKCLLIELWGDKFIRTLEEDTSLSRLWLGVEQSFERAKRTASPSHRKDKINLFTVAAQMYNKYQKTCGGNILQNSENNDKLGVLFDKDDYTVALNHKAMDGLFNPTVLIIVKHIDELLRKRQNISYIFMVGGFSTSKYLTSAVRKKLVRR